MRGLPDSAVLGTYKRLTRKGRKSARQDKGHAYYQANADVMNRAVDKFISLFIKK